MNQSTRARWLIDVLVGTVAGMVLVKGVSEAFTGDHLSWLVSLLVGFAIAAVIVTGWYSVELPGLSSVPERRIGGGVSRERSRSSTERIEVDDC